MKAVPIELREAQAYIDRHHRHHRAAHRDKFRIAAADSQGNIIGVIQVGRPVSRRLDDRRTLEVLRLCTEGKEKNVCSFLYSRAARIAREMGYSKIITYILETETGTTLKASGWHLEKESAGGGSWDTPSRPREMQPRQLSLLGEKEKYPTCRKQRWAKDLGGRQESRN